MSINLTPPINGLIGHRGLAGHAPENTLIGIETAIELGLNWVEFDIQLTKDHELIIIHDDWVDRTTSGKGLVYNLFYEEIAKLDAGSWYAPQFAGTPVPSLRNILPNLLKSNITYNFELKLPDNPSLAYTQALTECMTTFLNMQWPTNKALPLVSSFEWDILLKIREKIPDLPIGFLCQHITPEISRLAAKTKNCSVNCDYRNLSNQDITRMNQFEIPLLAYTVNDLDIANQLLNQGVYGVFTDSLTATRPAIKKAV